MRRIWIGALAVAATVVPLWVTASAAPAGGSDAFCDRAEELAAFYSKARGLDMTRTRSVANLRVRVRALTEVAPKSLVSSFRTLLHFYDLIVSGEIELSNSKREDRYAREADKAAVASLKVARRLDKDCGIAFRG
jgi:hypothetical protein